MMITNAVWPEEEERTLHNIEQKVKWLSDTITAACDSSMSRAKKGSRMVVGRDRRTKAKGDLRQKNVPSRQKRRETDAERDGGQMENVSGRKA